MLTVSVIVVNYNSGIRIANVCAALEAQTYTNFDVIILDNASEDDSIDAASHNKLKLSIVQNPMNTGFAGGVMDALPHATGDWIAVLNPDAYPDPYWLERLVNAAKAYGPKTFLGSVQVNADHRDVLDGLGDVYHISGVAWRGGFGKKTSLYPVHQDAEIFAPCFAAAFFDRQRFTELGGLDRDFFCYHEDVDIGFRNRLQGGRSILVHDAIVYHEGSAITGRYSTFTVHHGIRNRLWTYVKNMPLPLLLLTLPVYGIFSAGFLLRSFMLGIGKPYISGFWAGLKGVKPMWRKRQTVRGPSPTNWISIAKAMSWSPIAPFRRAPDLRPVPPQGPHQK